MKNVLIAGGVFAVGGAIFFLRTSGVTTSPRPLVSSQVTLTARDSELIEPTLSKQESRTKIKKQSMIGPHQKLNFTPSLLASNTAFIEANPGIDISKLKPGDPSFLALKVPRNTPLVVLRGEKCGQNAASFIGTTKESAMGENFEELNVPKFTSVTTDEESTIGDLGAKIAADDCTLGVFPDGPLDSVRIPNKADLERTLLEHPVANLAVYDFKSVIEEGYGVVKAGLVDGSSRAAQVYITGAKAEHLNVPEPADPTTAVKYASVAGGAGEVYMLPLPSTGSPSQQIANANNAVLTAISKGAHFVLVPSVDPAVFAAVAQYAAQNNVKIYMVPIDVRIFPEGSIRTPASNSESH